MNMEIDRKSLSERLFKHEGFLYKIEDDGEDIYYFLGYYIFCICDPKSSTTVSRYNKMIEAINSNEKEEICNQFRRIVSRSNSREQYGKDTRKNFNNFIVNLNDNQFDGLKKQVQQFEDLWNLYGLH